MQIYGFSIKKKMYFFFEKIIAVQRCLAAIFASYIFCDGTVNSANR